INSAAITGDILFSRMEEGEWDQVIGVNLSGVFFCMREAGRAMVEKGEGHIINISSYAAYTGRVGQASYAASKRGLIALTQSAAKEWGRSGVQVNAVLPGYLPTPMTASLPPVEKKRMIQENTLGRPSTLEEVSRFIFDLSRMKHVSGQVFNLDSRILPFF
ncbi:MAG TPA: SDR family NAD(P)-dependent oxidoreductase, partial [Candidatus Manganitrophaceae bacterium]|nr:SDR family NAD(P)-dependent oxidoreductase [Candidatus Manganitrophaceae bacterium]